MKRINIFLVMIFLFSVFLVKNVHSNTNIKEFGTFKYIKIGTNWYTNYGCAKNYLIDSSHIIIKPKNQSYEYILKELGLHDLRDISGSYAGGFRLLQIPESDNKFEILGKLFSSGYFEFAYFNTFGEWTDITPNDPYFPNQWNLSKIKMPQAWEITKGKPEIIVAILDSGTDYNHPDLNNNIWSSLGYDFYGNDNDPFPTEGRAHGTAIAGLIAAELNNNLGVAGIGGGWNTLNGISLMILKVGGSSGPSESAVAQAIFYSIENGADVMNMSFEISQNPNISEAIQAAIEAGVVIVASTGNYIRETFNNVKFPANISNVIAVGASTEQDKRKYLNDGTNEPGWGSCYGPEIDVVAPGIHIPTTDIQRNSGYNNGDYHLTFNGTSSAAPHVSALVALIRSVNNTLTPTQVREVIINSADKVGGYTYVNGFNQEIGYGRINVKRALDLTPRPLAITISGPTYLNPGQIGTFTANPSGGSGSYTNYRWWERMDEGGGLESIESDNIILAPPPGQWVDLPFTTQTIQIARTYSFSLKCEVTDSYGAKAEDIHSVSVGGALAKTSLAASLIGLAPDEFTLSPNFPNPFNPTTTFSYTLAAESPVTILIYNSLGQEVATLVDELQPAGQYQATWNAAGLPSGVYFCQLKANGFVSTRRMHLQK